MKSIQKKLVILVLIGIIGSILLTGIAIMYNYKSVVNDSSSVILNLMCDKGMHSIDRKLTNIEQAVDTMAEFIRKSVDDISYIEDNGYRRQITQKVENLARNISGNTEGAMSVYFRYDPKKTDGLAGFYIGKTAGSEEYENFEITNLDETGPEDGDAAIWYYKPVANKEPTWLEPYKNATTGEWIVSYVVPVYKEGQLIGIIGMDMLLSVLKETADDISIYNRGYAFLVTKEAMVVHHSEMAFGEKFHKKYDEIVNIVKNSESLEKPVSYTYDGEDKKLVMRTLKNNMRLLVTVPVNELNEEHTKVVQKIIIVTFIISAFFTAVTYIFAKKFTKPIIELNEATKKIIDGDLSVNIVCDSKDEIGVLANNFDIMAKKLSKNMERIKELAINDEMTKVKNKTAFLQWERNINERMKKEKIQFGIVVSDVNNLKKANDTYGHSAGDEMIKDMAKVLCGIFKHSPVFRIGGDEFAVIIEGVDYRNVYELINMIEFETKKISKGKEEVYGNLTSAYGVAFYEENRDMTFQDVFNRADVFMYRNKRDMKKTQEEYIMYNNEKI